MLDHVRQWGKEALLRSKPGLFWAYVRVRHGHLEPEMALLPRLCQPDKISVDVGANFGVYSYYMLRYSGEVVAFEPYPRLAKLLRSGLGDRLQVHQVALSNSAGTAEMQIVPAETGYNTIEPSNELGSKVGDPGSIHALQVEVRRLDDFELGPVGFIKIDVEGHEQEVVLGSIGTIMDNMPALLLEVEERHRRGTTRALMHQLGELGYHSFFLNSGRLVPGNDFKPQKYQDPTKPDAYVRNFIFLPEHRLGSFKAEISDT